MFVRRRQDLVDFFKGQPVRDGTADHRLFDEDGTLPKLTIKHALFAEYFGRALGLDEIVELAERG
ncbi:MAG: hypothetical protein V3S83_12460 [Gemmatimonadota bacterium]